jgi:hypothetical protein
MAFIIGTSLGQATSSEWLSPDATFPFGLLLFAAVAVSFNSLILMANIPDPVYVIPSSTIYRIHDYVETFHSLYTFFLGLCCYSFPHFTLRNFLQGTACALMAPFVRQVGAMYLCLAVMSGCKCILFFF